MKYALRFILFASALIAVVSAFPGKRETESEIDSVELEKAGPIIVLSEVSEDPFGDGLGTGFFGSGGENPLNRFMLSMQSMVNRLRQQIAESLPSYPGQGSFFGISNIPEGANTTSTTKVINGHVVTVNETTYSDGDDVQGTIVRVRIVDIKPEDEEIAGNPEAEEITPDTDGEDAATPSNTDRSIESLESEEDNEIPKRSVKIPAA